MEDLKNIIESLLFVAEDPLSVERVRSIVPETSRAEIRAVMNALATEYSDRRGAFRLREVAGGYQIRTETAYSEWIRRMVKTNPPRLSRAALETLSIIAYYKPIIRAEIERIRGVDSGGILRMLLEKDLIRIMGRKEIPGRPLIYETTRKFLEIFELKDIKDLPSLKEIQALVKSKELLDEDRSTDEAESPPLSDADRDVTADNADGDTPDSIKAATPARTANEETASTTGLSPAQGMDHAAEQALEASSNRGPSGATAEKNPEATDVKRSDPSAPESISGER